MPEGSGGSVSLATRDIEGVSDGACTIYITYHRTMDGHGNRQGTATGGGERGIWTKTNLLP